MLNTLSVFPKVPTALPRMLSIGISPHPALEQSLGVYSLPPERRWLFRPEPGQPQLPPAPWLVLVLPHTRGPSGCPEDAEVCRHCSASCLLAAVLEVH